MKRALALSLLASSAAVLAQSPPATPGTAGPYNLIFLQGGIGTTRALPADTPILRAGAAWSLTSWVRIDVPQSGPIVLASIGDRDAATSLLLDSGKLALRVDGGVSVQTS